MHFFYEIHTHKYDLQKYWPHTKLLLLMPYPYRYLVELSMSPWEPERVAE